MADSGNKSIAYEVTADGGSFISTMEKVAASSTSAASTIKSQFDTVGKAFEAVQKSLLALTAVVGGGAYFKAAIDATNKLTSEAVQLSKRLGITADEAGVLNTALGDIGSDSDTYISAFDKFARQLKKNEQGLQDMGLQTRDANGNLRDSNELFTEAVTMVGTYKAGLDQSIASQTLFGKSIADVTTLQKLNTDVLEKARQKNEELGLTITQGNVEASKKYKLAMNDVSDVLTAVQKTVGDAVMPVFTELAEYFATTGPAVIAVFKGALTGVLLVFRTVQAGVKFLVDFISETINTLMDELGNFSELLGKIFSGDFSGAADVWEKMKGRYTQGINAVAQAAKDTFHEAQDSFAKDLDRVWTKGAGAGKQGKSGANTIDEKDSKDPKDPGRTAKWEAELEERKLAFQEMANAQGSFEEYSKQQEATYWQGILALTTTGTAENLTVRKKLADLELSMGKDRYAVAVETLKAEEAAYKNNTDARMAILEKEAALAKDRYGSDSKEYATAQKAIIETRRQAVEQLKQIDQVRTQSQRDAELSEIAIEVQTAQLKKQLGLLSVGDELVMQQQFEDRRYTISEAALNERLALAEADPDRNPVELAKIHAELEALEQAHAQRIGAIRAQQTQASLAPIMSTLGNIQSAWSGLISKLMSGTITIGGFIKGIFASVGQAVIGTLADMAAKWAVTWLTNLILSKTTAAGEITANAAVAGAAATASAAAIPFVGWAMAPEAGAAAYAAALAYLPAASAEGGYDIPSGLNPIVQAHAREMVLPEKHADVIRKLADANASGSSGGMVNVELPVVPMPGGFFMAQRDHIVAALKKAGRDGGFWKK